LKRYESSFCTFGVPDDWEPQPPFGFMEPGGDEDATSAQVMERWLEAPVAPAAYAAAQKEVLPHLLDGLEWQGEGPHPLEGPGQAHFLDYRFVTEDGDPALQRTIYVTHGPFLAELSLFRLVELTNAEKEKLLQAVGRTFALRGMGFLERAEPLSLFAGLAGGEEGEKAADSGQAEPAVERRKFPRCCVSLPLPEGWEVTAEEGEPVLRRSGVELGLRRMVGHDGDAETWYSERLGVLQRTAGSVFGTTRGELRGMPYAAVLFEEGARERRWSSAAVRRRLEVFVEGEQALLGWLEAPPAKVRDAQPVLERLLAGMEWLDPHEWETKLAEPWVDLVLEGPWRSEGPGAYVNLEEEVLLHLSCEENKKSLEQLRPEIVESLRQGLGLREITHEEEALGELRGVETLRYSVEGVLPSGGSGALQTAWLVAGGQLYSIVSRGGALIACREAYVAAFDAVDPVELRG
jgi:hypothetical protein